MTVRFGLLGAGRIGKVHAKAIAGNPLIASYDVQKTDDGGTRLIITLRKNAKTTYDALLSPQGASGFRVVLDLQASP